MSYNFYFPAREWPPVERTDDSLVAPVDMSPEDSLSTDEVSDEWLDCALRTVALPRGFLDRMSVLAEPMFTDHFDSDGQSCHVSRG
jgi:hypothetical protein